MFNIHCVTAAVIKLIPSALFRNLFKLANTCYCFKSENNSRDEGGFTKISFKRLLIHLSYR